MAGRKLALALATAVGSIAVLFATSPASANEATRPYFQLPFACATSVRMETGPTHTNNGPDSLYKAIDMYKPPAAGTSVKASFGGTVQYVSGSSTNAMYINHGNGWRSMYAHMSSRVANGASVSRGQSIGIMDNIGTGNDHLHYEQQYNGVIAYPRFNGKEYRLAYNGNPYVMTKVSHNCSTSLPTEFCTYRVNSTVSKQSWGGSIFESEGTIATGTIIMAGTNGMYGGYRRVSIAGGADRQGPFVDGAKISRSSGGCTLP